MQQRLVVFCAARATRQRFSPFLFPRRLRNQFRCFTSSSSDNINNKSLLRFDVMTGTWVVFSSGRRNRPHQTTDTNQKICVDQLPDIDPNCPFCQGNEHMTPHTLLELNSMRVVPNKYPAVAPLFPSQDGQHHHHTYHHHEHMSTLINDGLLLNNQVPACGNHEVVIESPFHNRHMASNNTAAAATDSNDSNQQEHHQYHSTRDLLTVFWERGRAHRAASDRVEHTVFFKNHGATAGASLVHPHSQIVSTTVVPVEAQRLQSLALDYFRRHRHNLYAQVVEEELEVHFNTDNATNNSSRVVDMTQHFIALVPYASAGPYVIKILPRYNGDDDNGVDASDFTTTTPDLLDDCALLLHSCLVRLQLALGGETPDFNLVVQTSPVPRRGVQAAVQAAAFFRWHIRITPRLGAGAMAGFELGSGFFSNSHLPEEDAAALRAVRPPLSQ